jgi:hypothetical protein
VVPVAGSVVRAVLEVRLHVVRTAAVALVAGGVVSAMPSLGRAGGAEGEHADGGDCGQLACGELHRSS